jgi:Flp pilus assembly protein TadG
MSTMTLGFNFRRLKSRRATAALEFGIVAPMIVTFLAAASDYGLAMWSKSCLTNAVAQGGYYAFRTGTTVTAANVQTLVQNVSSLTGVTATATNPTYCYCPSGTPAVLGSAVSCASTCADGSNPGNYIMITGSYTLTGSFPLTGIVVNGHQISDTVVVRLK